MPHDMLSLFSARYFISAVLPEHYICVSLAIGQYHCYYIFVSFIRCRRILSSTGPHVSRYRSHGRRGSLVARWRRLIFAYRFILIIDIVLRHMRAFIYAAFSFTSISSLRFLFDIVAAGNFSPLIDLSCSIILLLPRARVSTLSHRSLIINILHYATLPLRASAYFTICRAKASLSREYAIDIVDFLFAAAYRRIPFIVSLQQRLPLIQMNKSYRAVFCYPSRSRRLNSNRSGSSLPQGPFIYLFSLSSPHALFIDEGDVRPMPTRRISRPCTFHGDFCSLIHSFHVSLRR